MHGQSPHAKLKKLATIWDLGINDYEPEPTNILHNTADCGKYAAIEPAKGLRGEHTRRLRAVLETAPALAGVKAAADHSPQDLDLLSGQRNLLTDHQGHARRCDFPAGR